MIKADSSNPLHSHYFFSNPTMIRSTIAPRIADMKPPIPPVPSSQPKRKPPMSEPIMPTMMFPISPNPWPIQTFPAIHPTIAPMISQIMKEIIPSIQITLACGKLILLLLSLKTVEASFNTYII